MLRWRIYNSNNRFFCSKNAHLCCKLPSILASEALLFLSSSLPLPLTLKIKVSPSYPPLAFSCLSVEAGVPGPCLWVSTLWCPGTLGHSGAICADAPSGHAWPSPSAAFSPRVIVFAGIETEPCLRKVVVEGTKVPVFLSLPSREVLVNLGGWTQKRLS